MHGEWTLALGALDDRGEPGAGLFQARPARVAAIDGVLHGAPGLEVATQPGAWRLIEEGRIVAHSGGLVDAQWPAKCGDLADGLGPGTPRDGARCGEAGLERVSADPFAGQVKSEDLDAVVGDAVPSPRRVETKSRAVLCGEGGAGVVAEELVAQAADEAHGDRPGHGMSVGAVDIAGRIVGAWREDEGVGTWKRHPRKDLERVLEEFAAHGWRIDDPPKYYRLRCTCGRHSRWLHLTPSNPRYGQEALQWAKRTCPKWKEGR